MQSQFNVILRPLKNKKSVIMLFHHQIQHTTLMFLTLSLQPAHLGTGGVIVMTCFDPFILVSSVPYIAEEYITVLCSTHLYKINYTHTGGLKPMFGWQQ